MGRRGFTLVELMVAATLFLLVSSASLGGLVFLLKSSQASRVSAREIQVTRDLHARFANDVRGATRVVTAEAARLALVVRGMADVATDAGHSVIYAYDPVARSLTRTEAGVTRVLLTGLGECQFGYRQRTQGGTNSAAVSAAAVNAITLSYRVGNPSDRYRGSSGQSIVSVSYQCRNLLLP